MNATATLARRGVLHSFELPAWEERYPLWSLYLANGFLKWIEATPEIDDVRLGVGRRSIREHLAQTFSDFRCSERPHAGDLRRLTPTRHGVWKMHPPRLRVYGWFPIVRTFIVVGGALESETKADKTLNNRRMKEVRDFIQVHRLEKHIVRGDIRAVFP
jgi:hypothetical protein